MRFFLLPVLWTLHALALDLTHAVIVAPRDAEKAVTVLVEEVEKRTQIRLEVASAAPAAGAAIVVESARSSGPPEGYRIRVESGRVIVSGNDSRGVLFGAGRLLRALDLGRRRIALRDDFAVTTAPKVALRGHQLGYRPKTNSYDGWTLAMWDQYIRDLAIFGANAIEL
ncbi:MAG: hypothetical protein HY013_03510, partial [Candidatus Solibacter usitatus]|nr:hypothetical protein [Candidatus Solibacter usitatus]